MVYTDNFYNNSRLYSIEIDTFDVRQLKINIAHQNVLNSDYVCLEVLSESYRTRNYSRMMLNKIHVKRPLYDKQN